MAENEILVSSQVVATATKSEYKNTVETGKDGQFSFKDQLDAHTKNIEQLNKDMVAERLNNITIFGIFASLVTFLSVEIQVFKNIDNFWLLIGLSAFLVGCLLLFLFSIHSIARDKLGWIEFFTNPLFWLFVCFIGFSFTIFCLNSKGINMDLHINSAEYEK